MSLFGRKENVFLRLMKLEETLNFVNALEKLLFIDTFGIQGFKQLIKFDLLVIVAPVITRLYKEFSIVLGKEPVLLAFRVLSQIDILYPLLPYFSCILIELALQSFNLGIKLWSLVLQKLFFESSNNSPYIFCNSSAKIICYKNFLSLNLSF